jgi:hypothetical protein
MYSVVCMSHMPVVVSPFFKNFSQVFHREILVSRKTPGFLRGRYPGGYPPFEFLKMHLYQYTQKIEHCSNKFDFLTLFCLEGLVSNSVLSGSRGMVQKFNKHNT